MQEITAWLQFASSVILVVITAAYVYIMKKILDTSVRQANLSYNPVIGIMVRQIGVGPVFGPNRRNLGVDLSLINVGNAPAIDISFDGEIILEYSNIEGEKAIPARFEPGMIPFIRVNEEVTEDPNLHLSFGNRCVTHMFDDMRECSRLNRHRIDTDPTRGSYTASRLRVIAYCRNNLGQWFQSCYEIHLYLDDIPGDDESAEFRTLGIPRPLFLSEPISRDEMSTALEVRNAKRKLCGW